MAARRAYWKGNLRLALVTCPVELFPATSAAEKISFNQINSKTGNRIRYKKVDAGTGVEVDGVDIVKGYEVAKNEYVILQPDEIDAVALDTTHSILIDRFVPDSEIDELFYGEPYFVTPDGDMGEEAFAVLHEAISKKGMVALGRVVFRNRENMVAIKPRGRGMVLTTLLYPYEVRKDIEYFSDIKPRDIDPEMMDMANQLIKSKQGHFRPQEFSDRYETALKQVIATKMSGKRVTAVPERAGGANVINLMEALKRSVRSDGGASKSTSRPAKKAVSRSATRARKAG